MMVLRRVVLVLFLFCIFSFSSVSAISVSPGRHDVDFEPGLEESFVFIFDAKDDSTKLEVYSWGDLSEYTTISPDMLIGSGKVDVLLKLPDEIDLPGAHVIRVGARPFQGPDAMVGAVAGVRGAILVHVPYPGKYADVEFEIEDANAGEKIPYRLKIYSRGDEEIITSSMIEIYDSENKSVGTFNLGTNEILPTEDIEINLQLDADNLGAGSYNAEVIVGYAGEEKRERDGFRLGSLNAKVVNYTRELKKNTINPFTIEVESLWNDKINDLYAEVFVVGTSRSFLTPSVELNPWRRTKLLGYFDTIGFEAGEEFQVKMVLHYDGETSEETAILSFVRTNNYLLIGSIIVGVIGIISFIMWVVIKLKRLEKRNGKKK